MSERAVTALRVEAKFGNARHIRKLLQKHRNYNVNYVASTGDTLLHSASRNGNLGVVRVLISEFKANVNTGDYQNNTPLHVAALCGNEEVVLSLITDFNCDISAKGYLG